MVLALTAVAQPSQASVRGNEDPEATDASGIQSIPPTVVRYGSEGHTDTYARSQLVNPAGVDLSFEHTDGLSAETWLWSKGRKALWLTGDTTTGARAVAAADLDTGEPAGFAALGTWTVGNHENRISGPRAVVDEGGGRMFVAYRAPQEQTRVDLAIGAAKGTACTAMQPSGYLVFCLGGFKVVDLDSMQVTGTIPFRPVNLDGVASGGLLRGLAYVPAAAGGRGDKLVALVEDWTGYANSGETTDVVLYAPKVQHLVQFDAATGEQEWMFRLDQCRGMRENRGAGSFGPQGKRPNPSAIMPLDRGASREYVVACHSGSAQTATVVSIPLDAQDAPALLPIRSTGSEAEGLVEQRPVPIEMSDQPLAFYGPEKALEFHADAVSGRVLIRVNDANTDVWWVFDTRTWQLVGTVGIGPATVAGTWSGLDDVHGRLYVLSMGFADAGEGMYVVDFRGTPLSQAMAYPEVRPAVRPNPNVDFAVDPAASDRPTRLHLSASIDPSRLLSFEDHVPRRAVSQLDREYFGRTLDIEESPGVTASTFDGTARGYGSRLLLVGGVDAAARIGPADGFGNIWQFRDFNFPTTRDAWTKTASDPSSPCTSGDRQVVLGFVGPDGPSVVDGSGARGSAEPVVVDSATRADNEAAISRCGGKDWDALWAGALLGRSPIDEPTIPWTFTDGTASCLSTDDDTASSVGDPLTGTFAARVECDETEASGFSYARGFALRDVAVAESLSTFRIYRDPGRGIVSRVESVARGVTVDGVLRIETVRGTAESWANGRRQPIAETARPDDYDPNCDLQRSAGSCFQRHVFGVWTPGYQCGPCGDEEVLLDRMNRSFGAYGSVRLRSPDAELARGSENGFIAAVSKPDGERFGDLVLNNDLLQTVIPTVEIIRQAPPNRLVTGGGPRGRQIIQLAGVEVSSSYSIQCLLVFDEETGTCSEAELLSGSLTVSLADPSGDPLAGGVFEVRSDTDADGVVGLVDELVGEGACVTAADGVGTCIFEGLEPGSYLVSQTAAPPGYSAVTEPWVSDVASGEARTVTFTNVSNVSVIEVLATGPDGDPVEGATFVVFPDPDADGKVAPDAQAAATCTTDASGVCAMEVPAGSYVLVQTVAPVGLAPIEPLAFAFASGGQTAAVGVTNSPAGPVTPDAPPSQASPVYSPPGAVAPPVESIGDAGPPVAVVAPDTAGPALSEQLGGTVVRVIRAPGDALRLLSRDPKQAVAWIGTLALFGLAALAVRRRQLLGMLTSQRPIALAGGIDGRSGLVPPTGRRTEARFPKTQAGVIQHVDVAVRTEDVGAAVLPRVTVAGAAPSAVERIDVEVILATADHLLAALIAERLAIAEHCTLVGTVHSLEMLRGALRRASAETVVIVDLTLPAGHGSDICDALAGIWPVQRVVGILPHGRSAEALATRGCAAGFAGLLAAYEDLANGQLAYAVRCVAVGKLYYGPVVQRALVVRWGDRMRSQQRAVTALLSERELEVAHLAASGLGRSAIAEELFLSRETVKRHLRAIRSKLGVTDPHAVDQLRRRLNEAGFSEHLQTGDPDGASGGP